MNNPMTLNLSEFVYKFGNDFFNLREEEWTPLVHDDLTYEETEKEGINGYVLKIEEQFDDYSNSFHKYIIVIYNWFRAFLLKPSSKEKEDAPLNIKNNWKNTEQCIQINVRKRLLDKLNEDIDKLGVNDENRSLQHAKPKPVNRSVIYTIFKSINSLHLIKVSESKRPIVRKNTFKE